MYIEQLARITGVSLGNIRRYRALGLLPSADGLLSDGFTEPDIHALKLIKLAVKADLSLREIVSILDFSSCGSSALHYARSYAILQARRNTLATAAAPENKAELSALDALIKELRGLVFN